MPRESGGGGGGVATTTEMPPSLVTPYDPRLVTASASIGANALKACRVIVRQSGTLHDLAVHIGGATSGNLIAGIFDTDQATAGVRTSLWNSGSVVCGPTSTWQVVGDPALAVTAGQQFDLAVVVDNATVTLGRMSPADAGTPVLPANFWPAFGTGDAQPKLAWSFGLGSFAWPASVTEANCGQSGNSPVLIARVA